MKVTDQLNRTIDIPDSCQRIVSLVPSQTELLVDLGLADRIVGVTKFCIHPDGFKKNKTIVGGTKQFNFEVIDSLKPDLILGNKEENYKEGIEQLARDYPVWVSDIFTLTDAIAMIESVGEITQTSSKAAEITAKINSQLTQFTSASTPVKRALYFIWKKPYMVAGSNNYINEMLRLSGFNNLCNSTEFSRYPELTAEEIKRLNPDTILLSSEPFPFKEKHIQEFKELLPNATVTIVDGELYSWYGSRIIKALTYFHGN